MSTLQVDQFEEFFHGLHERDPFPWQSMLLRRVASEGQGWPDMIDLPTASGKTACMDVALFALALGVKSPRRIWFIVDRRIVVDEAHERAVRVADKLLHSESGVLAEVARRLRELSRTDRPVAVARLRGSAPRSLAWSGNPAQPTILTSTLDQVASRLLFRGYGLSQYAQPVHAALAGNDSLLLLDEAHLATAFAESVRAVEGYRVAPWVREPLGLPFKLVVMSATPADAGARVVFPSPEERAAALQHPLLEQRIQAAKPAVLVEVKPPFKPRKGGASLGEHVSDDALVLEAAQRAMDSVAAGHRRVAVMVNRVATARLIHAQLGRAFSGAELAADRVLITGRLRPVERDAIVAQRSPALRSGSNAPPDRPIIVITTQCLEVGADFSFDALITECASIDALRQRFGRLNRMGTLDACAGAILVRNKDANSKDADPVYGDALAQTWRWLWEHAAPSGVKKNDAERVIDMGIAALAALLPEDLSPLRPEPQHAPVLLPAYLDLWSQTSPRPAIEPEVALFIHGVPPRDHRPRVNVRLLWRNELAILRDEADELWVDAIAAMPPLPAEMVQVPLGDVRKALGAGTGRSTEEQDDLEATFEDSRGPGEDEQAMPLRAVRWRGRDDAEVITDLDALRPDDVLVLPTDNPLFTVLQPGSTLPPDVYDRAFWATHEQYLVRFPASLGAEARRAPDLNDEAPSDRDVLQWISDAAPGTATADAEMLQKAICKLGKRPRKLARYAADAEREFWVITSRTPPTPVDLWLSDLAGDESELLSMGDADGRLLDMHTRKVGAALRLLHGLVPEFADTLQAAADRHDWGKADARFQSYLAGHGRRPVTGPLLAKSSSYRPPAVDRALRDLAGLPRGFRHELLSTQLAAVDVAAEPDAHDLLLHLIASHHGRCRPFAPVVDDPAAPSVCVASITLSAAQRRAVPPHRLDSGIAERFWRLTRRYGWWGLAYLEALLRTADQHASATAMGAPRMSPTEKQITLTGLDGSNPLAFLAALGVLRALQWSGIDGFRMSWGPDLRPVLHGVSDDLDASALVARLAGFIRVIADHVLDPASYPSDVIRITSAAFQQFTRQSEPSHLIPLRRAFAAAFGSDAVTSKEGDVEPTRLSLANGNGHKKLLGAFRELAAAAPPATGAKPRRKSKAPAPAPTPDVAALIQEALFEWRYRGQDGSKYPSVRWDPDEFRTAAHMAAAPDDTPQPTVPGATLLAVVGLTALPSAPTSHGLVTTCMFTARTDELFCWPLWDCPLSTDTAIALLTHAHDNWSDSAAHVGIQARFAVRRIKPTGQNNVYFGPPVQV